VVDVTDDEDVYDPSVPPRPVRVAPAVTEEPEPRRIGARAVAAGVAALVLAVATVWLGTRPDADPVTPVAAVASTEPSAHSASPTQTATATSTATETTTRTVTSRTTRTRRIAYRVDVPGPTVVRTATVTAQPVTLTATQRVTSTRTLPRATVRVTAVRTVRVVRTRVVRSTVTVRVMAR
jgi:cytoskeletal protein RodZ